VRADRLLSILFALQSNKVITAKCLAKKLEVSERTIYRDIDALNFSGVPIYAIQGSHGGFALDEHFYMDLSAMGLPELKSLLINRSPDLLKDLGIITHPMTIKKIMQNLPESYKSETNQFIKRVYLDSGVWFGNHESIAALPIIEKALESNLQIQINYQKESGQIIFREVAPYGLVAKTSAWYLIAKHDNILRVYRVSRITGLDVTNTTFTFPEHFSISSFWSTWCHEFENSRPRYPVLLCANQDGFHELSKNGYTLEVQDHELNETWLVIDIQFETFDQALREVLALGSKAKVIQPEKLKVKVIESAQKLVNLYGEQ
jgi:predicted DNA-binding transcriptional regulator YafY